MAQRTLAFLILALLICVPSASIAYKVAVLDYRLSDVLPVREYHVTLSMTLDGHDGRARVRTFVPDSDARQTIESEAQSAPVGMRFESDRHAGNHVASWIGSNVADGTALSYAFAARIKPQRYEIDPQLWPPESYPAAIQESLKPEEFVQVDAPEIHAVQAKLGSDEGPVKARLQRIFDFTAAIPGKPFKGTTDALTALRLGEASCNGKGRLFVALARAAGIPARLVGGLLLEVGRKRTSHQWVEAYVGGHWVPFDPTNHHFAELPGHYVSLYRGDEVLFRHTADVNFDYAFTTTVKLVPAPQVRETFSAFNVWDLFARLGLPFSLLKTVLMLPIGALVVVLFRNVIGMPTFGTFLPALIAAAAGETGIFWGIVSLLIVMTSVILARGVIQYFGLLHSPTLAILLAVVVVSMLGTGLLADHMGFDQLARITYFPIAVLAIASERFYLALVEQGAQSALKQLAGTLTVVLACFLLMGSLAVQVLVSAFPEILLLVVVANVYLGRWVGMRVFELWRFRHVLRAGAQA